MAGVALGEYKKAGQLVFIKEGNSYKMFWTRTPKRSNKSSILPSICKFLTFKMFSNFILLSLSSKPRMKLVFKAIENMVQSNYWIQLANLTQILFLFPSWLPSKDDKEVCMMKIPSLIPIFHLK